MIYADKELMKLTKKELIDLVEEYTDDKKHMFGQIHKLQLDLNDLNKASEPLSTEVKKLKRCIEDAETAIRTLMVVNYPEDFNIPMIRNHEECETPTSDGYRQLEYISRLLTFINAETGFENCRDHNYP